MRQTMMRPDQLDHFNREFIEKGYCVVDLDELQTLDDTRDAILEAVERATDGRELRLTSYHERVTDEAVHQNALAAGTRALRADDHTRKVVSSRLDFFRAFVGPDLCLQRLPYLRIARPGREEDNVNYHRDTHYGRSPFELSVWIPFVDVPAEMALRVLPGSHVAPESDFPTRQEQRPDVPRGGLKHSLGYPYAPKLMSPEVEAQMVPVPVKYGQMLVFSLSIVHGQRVNTSGQTRFSCDTRVVSALAPIAWEASVSGGQYYGPLSRSAVTEQACRYALSNRLELSRGTGLGVEIDELD